MFGSGSVVMLGGLTSFVNLPLFGLGLILLGLSFFVGNKKIIDSEGNNVTRSGGASGSGKPNRLPKRVTRTGGVVAVIASILASLGFGGGGLGTGAGTGDAAGAGAQGGTASVAESVYSEVAADGLVTTLEDAAEQAKSSNVIALRVEGTEIYANECLIEDTEGLSSFLKDTFTDSMRVTLEDDYADDTVFSDVEKALDTLGISYTLLKE